MAETEYLIRLPWPPSKTSKNGPQGDYFGKAKAAKKYKTTCAKECMARHVRQMDADRVQVDIEFFPPTAHAFDLDNILARAKQGLDAVSEAIGVDDSKWDRMTLTRGPKLRGGCLLVHIKPISTDLYETIPFEGSIM